MRKLFVSTPFLLAFLAVSGLARAQNAPAVAGQEPPPAPTAAQGALPPDFLTRTVCGTPLTQREHMQGTPPPGSTFFWQIELCFPTQGGVSSVETDTYLYYMKLAERVSLPSQNVWNAWDERMEQQALADFNTLMRNTTFLEDMRIEVTDYTFPNGAVGKIVSYIAEERERVKIVDYRDGKGEPIKILKRSDIDDKLREKNVEMRLDAFLDAASIRRVKSVLDELMTEKGFANADITHTVSPVAGGPKLVNVTFNVAEGPKMRIRRVEFEGNSAISDGTLQRKLKENKPKGILSWITGGGTFKETAFEEDAARVVDFYQREGYARARVGQPELKVIEDSEDRETRWIELRIPVTEGPRYRMGTLTFDGNKVVPSDALKTVYKLEPGDWYSRKELYDGFRKTQEAYGSLGYMEWTPAPVFKYSDEPDPLEAALDAQVPELLAAPPGTATNGHDERNEPPVVDVTVQMNEGPQYFVNRITFTGNTTTRDNVIRREMRLYEGLVFNTEALKNSVRRLNQLGYFTEIHGDERDTKIDKTPDKPNNVDITVRVAEQNRNQLTFGAGVSQYEGVFGQLAFQTSNFMGRGESLTVQMTAGDRSQNYQLAFTEPFLFDRNITGGFDVYKRSLDYIGYYTQKSTGGNLMFGFPVADFSRMFVQYAFERVKMANLNEALIDPSCISRDTGCSIIQSLGDLSQLTPTQIELLNRNPFVADSLLIGQGGSRTISRITPSFVHNTVDNPIFPNEGKRFTAAIDLALLGGNTKYYKPRLEAIYFKRHLARTSFGFRAQAEYIEAVGSSQFCDPADLTLQAAIGQQRCEQTLPIFERLFLGGEYSIRGFDIRSIGPTVPGSQVVLGGNKSLLFNAEYLISIASQVRLVLFYDAGQVRNVGDSFAWKEDLTELVFPPTPPLIDPFATSSLTALDAPGVTSRVIGQTSAFKTSTGIELRFFMPVLNVPFRLIYAWNPQRAGVLDNNLRPQKETVFRFAVGTTF
jgi:outer membrane protein insertion porin family